MYFLVTKADAYAEVWVAFREDLINVAKNELASFSIGSTILESPILVKTETYSGLNILDLISNIQPGHSITFGVGMDWYQIFYKKQGDFGYNRFEYVKVETGRVIKVKEALQKANKL